jgi:hypothetical protein
MAKNRKAQPSGVRFGPIAKVLSACLLIGGVGIGYVQQQTQLHILAKQRRDRETRLERLRHENERRLKDVDALQTPAKIEERIKQMNLGLIQPQPDQIVHIAERTLVPRSSPGFRLLAEQAMVRNNVR